MSKSTANNAIDFKRIFDIKDKLTSKVSEVSEANSSETTRGDTPRPTEPAPSAQPSAAGEGTVLDFPSVPTSAPPAADDPMPPSPMQSSVVAAAAAVIQLLPPPPMDGAVIGAGEENGPLRIGLPRALHQRVRAAAAMACSPPVTFVRDLLEGAAPRFDASASLASLGQVARDVFPPSDAGRRSIDVRMQVRVSEELHRRLVQLAALRAQTLGACLIDALEHQLPR